VSSAPVATPAAASAAPRDEREPTALASAPVQPVDAGETVAVQVKIKPDGAQLFQKGKYVGRCPFTLELTRGERRTFEVVAPGYVTRRLVLDGSKPVISFGMKPVANPDEE
jgi:hypothetical protein